MPRAHLFREVPEPDHWAEWPPDAQINYLSSTMGRDQLLQLVGELAEIPDEEIGKQSIHKSGLAQLIVTLERLGAGEADE